MPGFPKSRPPANAKALETWISQKAHEDGVAVSRARRDARFMQDYRRIVIKKREPWLTLAGDRLKNAPAER